MKNERNENAQVSNVILRLSVFGLASFETANYKSFVETFCFQSLRFKI